MPLTDIQIKAAQPGDKPQRLFDGGGLYLEVSPAGGRWWRFKYRMGGKERRLSLGTYPDTPLKTARARRDEARQMVAEGIDPSAERKRTKVQAQEDAAGSFRTVALAWLEHQAGRWNPDTRATVLSSLEADAFPTLGRRPLVDITAKEVLHVVQAIEGRGVGETASRVLQRVKAVFRYAVVHTDLITKNPMLDLKPEEVLRPRQVRHRAALPESELPTFLARLGEYQGDPLTRLALRILVLTVVRPGELRGASWHEIDLDAARWRIGAERMKMKREHLVPLSRQAVEAFRQARAFGDGTGLVFPSPFYPGAPMSENTLNSALARMGFKGVATAHGMRALFSTVANEHGHDPDVIERQLAHVEKNATRAAYHRATYLPQRAELLQWWADFVDARAPAAK